jgi:phosphatidylglycerophosphate synthase
VAFDERVAVRGPGDGSVDARCTMSTRWPAVVGGMCWTISTDAGKSGGSWDRSRGSASTPPADVPTSTTSRWLMILTYPRHASTASAPFRVFPLGAIRVPTGTARASPDAMRAMWTAHLLTLSRVPLALAFWPVAAQPAAAIAVLAAAAATDLVDGRVARWARAHGASGRAATLGAWLDPVCDKIFAVLVLAALAVSLHTPLFVLAMIGARELVVGPLAIVYRFTSLHHRYVYEGAAPIGKLATATQFVAIGALVLHLAAALALAILAGALGLFAAAAYVHRALSHPAGRASPAAS